MSARTLLVVFTLAAVCLAGCSGRRSGPYQPLEENVRDPREADRLNSEASAAMASNPARAERLLRDALTADLYHGAAHNNLGVLFLQQGRLYEAAGEFEWAAKLMPGHPDPRLNLALTLEKAGRTDEALEAYGSTLDVSPEHVPTMQALARLQVRAGRDDHRTPDLLREIAMRGETDLWRDWARGQMTRLGHVSP